MNSDILFNIILHLDEKSVIRLKVTHNQINNMVKDILNDSYFWKIKMIYDNQQNLRNEELLKSRDQFGKFRLRFYLDDYVDYFLYDSDDYQNDNEYLDDYILPPRNNNQDYDDDDDFIYRLPSLTKNELDDELDEIQRKILICKI
jgi:hypothetical protein